MTTPGAAQARPAASGPDAGPDRSRHSALDNAQGIVGGVLVCALGLHFLQPAGLALIAACWTGDELVLCFFLINLPFQALALLRMGRTFGLRMPAAVALVSS